MARRPEAEAARGGERGLAVVVRPGDGLGFRLAGAAVDEVAAGGEAAVLRRLVADPAVGVVAVEEEILRALPPRLLRRAQEAGVPVLLPFSLPRRWGESGRGEAYVAALIRRAVGYAVKLGSAGGGS
jgi:V/A-type H+-transporting ATPase subunit F